jgi:hypothetical protein
MAQSPHTATLAPQVLCFQQLANIRNNIREAHF